jgi:hypothetical protein
LSTSERALTKPDREILKPYSSADAKRSNYLAFAGISFMLFMAVCLALGLLWDFISWMLVWPNFEVVKWWICGASAVISSAYSGGFAITEHKYITSNKGIYQLADEDLKNGFAAIEHLEVIAVVEVVEEDDEGAGFLLELRDGRVLFLIGQHLYPYSLDAEPEEKAEAEGNIFPSNKIDFVYAPRSGVVLDAKGTGTYLKPRSRVKWQGDGPRSKPYHGPLHDSFNNGPLADLIKRTGFVEEAV